MMSFGTLARWALRRSTPAETYARNGVAIFRDFIDSRVAAAMEERTLRNLARLGSIFPNYLTDANLNVFSLAVTFADPNDGGLAGRIADAIDAGTPHSAAPLTAPEAARMRAEIGDTLCERFAFLSAGGVALSHHSFARFELARPNSPYDYYALHQDAVPQLGLDTRDWTAWLSLSHCGQHAPSLQYVSRKFSKLLVEHDTRLFLEAADAAKKWRFARPVLRPGDLVLFNAYTLHGTWITREMNRPRCSLDIRLSPVEEIAP